MIRILSPLMLVAFLIPGLTGCGPSPEERRQAEREEAAENLEEGAEDFADAIGALGEAFSGAAGTATNNENLEPVERQALAGVMPESISGMDRTNIESAREGVMGMTVTHAEGDFENGESRFTLKITDLAGVPMAGMLGAAWAMSDIDRESDEEIERTFTYEGNRAYERYNTPSTSGEMSILINGFMVEGNGSNMSRDQIREAMNDAPLRELENLR